MEGKGFCVEGKGFCVEQNSHHVPRCTKSLEKEPSVTAKQPFLTETAKLIPNGPAANAYVVSEIAHLTGFRFLQTHVPGT